MNRFSLLDIKDIDLKTWQQIALTYPNQSIQSKHISLARLADRFDMDETFLKILTYITAQKKLETSELRTSLDLVALQVLKKIKFKANKKRNAPILRDIITHIEHGRTTQFKTHSAIERTEYGKTIHDGGTTQEVVHSIVQNSVGNEQGIDSFIHCGENYIVFNLVKAALNRDWLTFFTSPIFEENPEKALQMQANMYNPHKQPFYQAEGHLTKPVIPRTQVYKELYKAIYRY